MRNLVFTVIYAVSGLVTAFLLSWVVLAQMNFLYGVWHDHVGIAEGIEEYGPLNRYREGFADTTREERVRLFGAINEAIHNEGEGLAEIYYHSESIEQPQRLLRPPEVEHLQDVAHLVDQLKRVGLVFALVWLFCSGWAFYNRRPLPKLKHQLVGIGSLFLVLGLLIAVIGPVTVFNQLHIWIFPAENQWFFYYQDSLMSTLMLAPRLFGWITIAWVPLAVIFYLIMVVGSYRLLAAMGKSGEGNAKRGKRR